MLLVGSRAVFLAAFLNLLCSADLAAQQAKFDEKTVGDFYRGKTIQIHHRFGSRAARMISTPD